MLHLSNHLISNKLQDNKINYFSFTLFKNNTPMISHCNNTEWLEIYNKEYNRVDITTTPPVQKYITASTLKLILWDTVFFDTDVVDYIKRRNNIVEVKNNVTVLKKKDEHLTVITFGTKNTTNDLLNFMNKDFLLLSIMQNFYL